MEGYDVRRLPIPEMGSSQGALLSAVVRLHPRIVLLDLDLGYMGDGVRLIAPIARSGAHVVVVTASAEKGRWGECLRYGARKVLTKARPLNEIMATVRRLNQGLPVMDRDEREDLLQAWHKERQEHQDLRNRLQRLTAREREVLGHLMEGHTVRDIARHQRGLRGHRPDPGEVHPGQARGLLAAGRRRSRPHRRLAAAGRLSPTDT